MTYQGSGRAQRRRQRREWVSGPREAKHPGGGRRADQRDGTSGTCIHVHGIVTRVLFSCVREGPYGRREGRSSGPAVPAAFS